jgi:hypothetical protein
MNIYNWPSIKIIASIFLLAIPSQGDLNAKFIFNTTGQTSRYSANEKDSTLMERDKVYNQLLQTLESFKALWKQQPENILALKRYTTQVQNQVTLLRNFDDNSLPASTPSSEGELTSRDAVSNAPSDTFQPSTNPSSEQEIEKRKKATDTFLSGPFDNSNKTKTLKSVSKKWIEKSCELAEAELSKINTLLSSDPLDHDKFNKSLEDLVSIMNQASLYTPETTPKGNEN